MRDGKFEFTVESVKTGVMKLGDSYLSTTPQGQFVLVTMKVTNIGNEAQYFDGSNQVLFDAAGRKYSNDSSAVMYLPQAQQTFLNQINPGNSVTGVVVYDVPKTMVPAAT